VSYYTGKDFWKKDSAWSYKPLQESILQEAEKQLKVQLPSSYISLLREQNGGEVHYSYFSNQVNMYFMEGIDIDSEGRGYGILASDYWIKLLGLPQHLVLLWGDFHHYIALDYKNGPKNPTVVYVWERYISNKEWGTLQLAPDFDKFLSRLHWRTKKIRPLYSHSSF
jgi:SMI1-KNR4 cell-wall